VRNSKKWQIKIKSVNCYINIDKASIRGNIDSSCLMRIKVTFSWPTSLRPIHQQCIPASFVCVCYWLHALSQYWCSFMNINLRHKKLALQRWTEHCTVSSSAQSIFEYSNICVFPIILPFSQFFVSRPRPRTIETDSSALETSRDLGLEITKLLIWHHKMLQSLTFHCVSTF